MATKPSVRILDWAGTGTTTDPGVGKEGTGWLVSERPPANWINWIYNSFGQWLSYFEQWTDENASLQAKIRSGATPSILYQNAGITSVTGSGNDLIVDLNYSFTGTNNMVALITGEVTGLLWGASPLSVSEITISAEDDAGANVDLTTFVTDFNLLVFGPRA